MPAFKESNLKPWQTAEGQMELSEWRKANMGKDYTDEPVRAGDVVKSGGEVGQGAVDAYEASALWANRNAGKVMSAFGKGIAGRVFAPLSYGLNVLERENALKNRYYARVHSPRQKTLADHIQNTYTYGLREDHKAMARSMPFMSSSRLFNPTGAIAGVLMDRSPMAMLESVPALLPFGDMLYNHATGLLPASMGGTYEGETREQYYQRTGRNIGHEREKVGETIGEMIYGTGRFRKMDDEELWKHIGKEKIRIGQEKNYQKTKEILDSGTTYSL